MTEWGEFPGEPGPGFVIPNAPEGIDYADSDDALARSLLESNGVALEKDALLAALDHDIEVM